MVCHVPRRQILVGERDQGRDQDYVDFELTALRSRGISDFWLF